MEVFKGFCPVNKQINDLEDLKSYTVKDLKKLLRAYKESCSSYKADLMLRVYSIFCRLSTDYS